MANENLVRQPHGELLSDEILSPVMNLQIAKKRLVEFQEFVAGYLIDGEDYGTIPGTPKPTLLKSGADKLCELYGLSDDYIIVDKVEDYEAHPPLFDYTVKCVITRIRTQLPVASGLGSCNSYETKYRYRSGGRACPSCSKEGSIIKGKAEYGGGWLCFPKKGGCGAKFEDEDARIVNQNAGKVENEAIADQKNTVLKMAKKRAKIDATLAATRSSGIFTQDVDEIVENGQEPQGSKQPMGTKKSAAAAKKQTRAHQADGDVKCNECGAINGHLPSCKYHPKNQGEGKTQQPAAQKTEEKAQEPVNDKRRRFFVDSVEEAKTAVREVDGKKKGGNVYLRLNCLDDRKQKVLVCCFHKTPMEYAPGWTKQWATMDVTEKPGSDGTPFFSMDAVYNVGGVQYKDNQPVESEPEVQGMPLEFDGDEAPDESQG